MHYRYPGVPVLGITGQSVDIKILNFSVSGEDALFGTSDNFSPAADCFAIGRHATV